MKSYRIFYHPTGTKVVQVAIIPAESVKQALTRFKAAGFDGVVRCVQDVDFDSVLFNV